MVVKTRMAVLSAVLIAVLSGACASGRAEVRSGQSSDSTSTTLMAPHPAIKVTDDQRVYDEGARQICDARVADDLKQSTGIEPPVQRDLVAAFDSTPAGAIAWAKRHATEIGEPPIAQQKLDEITKDLKVPGDSLAAVCWILGDWLIPDVYAAPNSWFVQLVLPDGGYYGLLATDYPYEPVRPA